VTIDALAPSGSCLSAHANPVGSDCANSRGARRLAPRPLRRPRPQWRQTDPPPSECALAIAPAKRVARIHQNAQTANRFLGIAYQRPGARGLPCPITPAPSGPIDAHGVSSGSKDVVGRGNDKRPTRRPSKRSAVDVSVFPKPATR
jgi:hypothetical protein